MPKESVHPMRLRSHRKQQKHVAWEEEFALVDQVDQADGDEEDKKQSDEDQKENPKSRSLSSSRSLSRSRSASRSRSMSRTRQTSKQPKEAVEQQGEKREKEEESGEESSGSGSTSESGGSASEPDEDDDKDACEEDKVQPPSEKSGKKKAASKQKQEEARASSAIRMLKKFHPKKYFCPYLPFKVQNQGNTLACSVVSYWYLLKLNQVPVQDSWRDLYKSIPSCPKGYDFADVLQWFAPQYPKVTFHFISNPKDARNKNIKAILQKLFDLEIPFMFGEREHALLALHHNPKRMDASGQDKSVLGINTQGRHRMQGGYSEYSFDRVAKSTEYVYILPEGLNAPDLEYPWGGLKS